MTMNKKVNRDTIKRLLAYIGQYKLQLSVVVVAIILGALANASSALFIQTLIDDYITPLLIESVPNFSGLFRILLLMLVYI